MTARLIGMVHLPALPGSPGNELTLPAIEERACRDARTLREAGFDAAILENYGDTPFFKERVETATVASMTRLAVALRRVVPELALGVNVLRNDALSAIAIATAAEAEFVRVNVHVGATACDQGILEGRAAESLRLRQQLSSPVRIWADVQVKHGRSLAHSDIGAEARDAVERGRADALIVSGSGTGRPTSLTDLQAVKSSGLDVPLYVGSGVSEDNLAAILEVSDGVIVGTSIKLDGITTNPVDPERCRRLVERARR